MFLWLFDDSSNLSFGYTNITDCDTSKNSLHILKILAFKQYSEALADTVD